MGSFINDNNRKILAYRGYTDNASLSSTEWLPCSQFQVGINQVKPSPTSTSLTLPIPINSGTVCDDGSNNFVGSSGGDNSTDNTSIYKDGANVVDNTGQNLIANNTGTSKIWTISALTVNASASKYIGFWLYINNQTTLDKFYTSGSSIVVRIGSNIDSAYYYKTYEHTDLKVGWNWLSDGELLSTWYSIGTVGTISQLRIMINTNNATDTFTAGDVVYDLLRQWDEADTFKDFSATFPSINLINREVTIKCYLNSVEAVGFLIDGLAHWNKDSTKKITSVSRYTNESKSANDEFVFIDVDRVI